MKTYTVKEAAEKLSMPIRTIQYNCKRDNVRKVLNVYQITDEYLDQWAQLSAKLRRKDAHILDEEKEALKRRIEVLEKENNIKDKEIEILEIEIEEFNDYDLKDYLPEIEDVPLEDIENFDFKFKRPGDLIAKKGNLVFVPKDMVFAEYTNEEYDAAEQKMTEWSLLQIQIDQNQKLFDANLKTIEQSEEHYKNSYFYQREQNERFIKMHEKLLETIQMNGKESFIKSVVDAKKTDWKK